MSATGTLTARTESLPGAWGHLAPLDGLRALAVVAVLLFHAGHLQGGFLGVDLFFALSGFLITSLLLRDATAPGGIDLLAFWGRRFRRLLPALFVMIAVVAVWAWAFGSPAELDGVRRDGLWALGYLANWHLIADAGGYWASFDQPSMFDHLWSLAVEEQFYVLWPLVVLLVFRLARAPQRTLTAVTAACVVASFLTMLARYDRLDDPTRVYMGTDTRASSILVGALLATAPSRRAATRVVRGLGRRVDALLAIAGAGVLWSWFATDGASSAGLYRGGLLVHSATCALVVVALATVPTCRTGRVLSVAPLQWIGVRSYGLYLWHWPVYVVVSADRTGLDGWTLTGLRLAVTAALTEVSLRVVERPIRTTATWARGRRGAVALTASFAAVAGLLLVLPTPEREIAAFDPGTITMATAVAEEPVPTVAAAPPAPATTAPATTATADRPAAPVTTRVEDASASDTDAAASAETAATTVPPPTTTVARPPIGRVLWTGDSIAYDQAPAILAALGDAGIAVDSTAFPGVRLVGEDRLSILPRLASDLAVSGADVLALQISVWDARAGAGELRDALELVHAIARDAGATVVFVPAPPTTDASTDALLVDVTERARELAAAHPDTTFLLDPTPVWGPSFDADLDDDGVPERKRDGVHVCPSGAARFATWFVAELSAHFDGVTPTAPTQWATGDWVTDARFDQPVGACAPL